MNSPVSNVTVGTVKVARLTEGALDAVVEIHMAAFPEYMNAQLGRGYLRSFLRGFLLRPEGVAIVAMSESGQALGYVAGAPVELLPEMNRALVPAASLAVCLRPWLLGTARIRRTAWNRVASIFGRRSEPKAAPLLPMPTLSLVSIGVDPQARGRSVGEQLMKGFEQEARARGCASLRLSVYPENAGARRFYERHGWVPFQGTVPPGDAMYYSKIF
ncbi:MAG TPA: hypothetical protein DCM86_11385 [Verrucomicrobiales bacterium]|nr:hypothetical protein [Verrucomicrobiales bacterium]